MGADNTFGETNFNFSPPAEGAEAYIKSKHPQDWDEIPQWHIDELNEFATLHAQRLAEKMAADYFDKMNCLIGYLERWWKNPQSYPPVELGSVIDEAIEYLKSREK